MQRRHDRDLGFFVWMIPGFLLAFGWVTQFSIGLPVMLAGSALLAYLLFRGQTWPADLGLIAGVGATSLVFIAIALLGDQYPVGIWAAIGLGLLAGSSALFWWLRCRPSVQRH